ncbi:hypothetical protein EJ110_NYTH47820 [Nymphaea thermarum]|nr:hypothetical protein EJ110_NYTH47820 [Nymphaea thermarum]
MKRGKGSSSQQCFSRLNPPPPRISKAPLAWAEMGIRGIRMEAPLPLALPDTGQGPLPGYWITPVLRVLRTLCHPFPQSRFMSGEGGAKRSSLNQTFDYTKSKKPKILDWPGNTAQLGAQEAKGMSFLHTFFSLRPFRMRFARHWRFALLLFFIGRFGWTSPFFPNSNRKGCITSRCRFVFRPQWDGEFLTSVPSSFLKEACGVDIPKAPLDRLASFQQPAGSTSVYDRAQ